MNGTDLLNEVPSKYTKGELRVELQLLNIERSGLRWFGHLALKAAGEV